jgi:hypothetical protein
MKAHKFTKVSDWYLNAKGKLDIDFPNSLSNTSGVIAMTVNEEAVFLASTTHYGPRIKDFKHSQSGEIGDAVIHHLIEECIETGKIVTVWVKDTVTPRVEKIELIKTLNPIWNK